MADQKVKIVVSAEDKASAELKKVNKEIDGMGEKSKKSGNVLKGTFTEMNSMLMVAEQAYQALSAVIKETVGVTVDYAAEVRDLQRASGMSAEETSKIIQVFDDMDVSAETLTMSLRKMSQEGITFSVDKMAEMSDEYLKLGEGAERNKFLLDNFGRAGLEMGKALEIGSDAIKQMADEMDGSLILTQENVDAAREYEIAMDTLNDTVMGVKISIGNELVPVMVKLADTLTMVMTAQDKVNDVTEEHVDNIIYTTKSYEEYSDEINRLLKLLGTGAWTTDVLSEAEWELARAVQYATEQSSGLVDMNEKLKVSTEDVTEETNNTVDAMKKYNEQLVFQIASEGLSADAALELAYAMGLVDQSTVYATEKIATYAQMLENKTISQATYTALVAGLAAALDGMPSDVNIDLWLKIHDYDKFQHVANAIGAGSVGVGDDSPIMEAAGGPVRPGQTVVVGESGPEILQMGQNGGHIYPTNVTNNFNLGVTTLQNANSIQTAFAIMQAMA